MRENYKALPVPHALAKLLGQPREYLKKYVRPQCWLSFLCIAVTPQEADERLAVLKFPVRVKAPQFPTFHAYQVAAMN